MSTSNASQVLRQSVLDSAQQAAAWHTTIGCGMIAMRGADRMDFLHRMTTNDLTHVKPGGGKQTVVVTEKARIIDVVTVMQREDEALLLTDSSTSDRIVRWLRKYVIMDDVKLTDVSTDWSRLDVVGEHASNAIAELFDVDVHHLGIGDWLTTTAEQPLTIVRIPSIGNCGYAVLGSPQSVDAVRDVCMANPRSFPQLTDDEYEYLRILDGLGKIGNELTEAYNPLEAGLLHLTSFTKGCYIGQEVIARLDSYNKVKQRLMGVRGLSMEVGDELVEDNNLVGHITSVTTARDGNHMLALAYVRQSSANNNIPITIRNAHGIEHQGTLHLLPMVDPWQ